MLIKAHQLATYGLVAFEFIKTSCLCSHQVLLLPYLRTYHTCPISIILKFQYARFDVYLEHARHFFSSDYDCQSFFYLLAVALGIRRIFIINGHHGNQKALEDAKTMANRACKAKTHVFSYWKFMDRGFDHAGHIETSLMLAISKNTRMNKAIKGFEEPTGAKLKEASRRQKSRLYLLQKTVFGAIQGVPRPRKAEKCWQS